MAFNQTEYISKFNKENYKMYQFRVKLSNAGIIKFLDSIDNRNKYIVEAIDDRMNVLTIKEIKDRIKPVLTKYGIKNVYLFGSYARGESKSTSDVDIYCDKGNVKTLVDQGFLEDDLKNALDKDVDIVFETSHMDDFFRKQIEEDMIKLC